MFYSYGMFPEENLPKIRQATLNWLTNEPELEIFTTWADDAGDFRRRALTPEEALKMDDLLLSAWSKDAFGGCIAVSTLSTVRGFCHFAFNEDKSVATLTTLILPISKVELPPYQLPPLHLALGDLVVQHRTLKKVRLPFATPPQLEDQAMLAMYSLRYQPGDPPEWPKADGLYELNRLLGFEVSRPSAEWMELRIEMDPDLFDLIGNLFSRHGFRQRIIVEVPAVDNGEGEAVPDIKHPALARTFLPLEDKAVFDETLSKIYKYITYMGQYRPVKPLQGIRRSLAEWREVWADSNFFRVGKRFVITPLFDEEWENPDDLVLRIAHSTREVFGVESAGPHPTTATSLIMLENYVNPVEHQKVLDMGTGTGILSIAMAKLGVPQILAIDANPLAVNAARENIEFNGLSGTIITEQGSIAVIPRPPEQFYAFEEDLQKPPAQLAAMLPLDLIVCNTLPHVLLAHAQNFHNALRSGGLLITSGYRPSEAPPIYARFEELGFEFLEQTQIEDWAATVHKKP
jgi:ribosomal protein L11 methylase PrmA